MRGKGGFFGNEGLWAGITPAYAGKSYIDSFAYLTFQDHPRVCGEKMFCQLLCCTLWGSPPRMRGKVDGGCQAQGVRGITPAYAGKSDGSRSQRSRSRDHPRVCGEKRCPGCGDTFLAGSPPRMRGKANLGNLTHTEERITPAYAGKSQAPSAAASDLWDHPRVCGEKRAPMPLSPNRRGKVKSLNGCGQS